MRRFMVFLLIFFLAFFIQFNFANASATKCHVYINGICQSWYHFDSREYEEFINETVEAPEETMKEVVQPSAEFSTRFLTLAFQFFGIVVLFILLIVMIEELTKSWK